MDAARLPERRAELIRLLEHRQFVFRQDPLLVSQRLNDSSLPYPERLLERAAQIDQDGTLLNNLLRLERRFHWVIQALTMSWLVLGFSSLLMILQASSLNFFAVLVSILGVHSVMLILWLTVVPRRRRQVPALPDRLLSRLPNDEISQSMAELYRHQLLAPSAFWYWSRISHQFWLCTLGGMMLALLGMLTIRQYTFNWQSTLLDAHLLNQWVQALGWLPSQLGFATPSADSVRSSQLHGTAIVAREWAGLLIGSLLVYGIVPRSVAWLVSWLLGLQQQAGLDLELPYYQHIIQRWTPKIVDSAENYRPDAAALTTGKQDFSQEFSLHTRRLAVLLESPDIQGLWARDIDGADWPFWGGVEDREQFQRLKNELQSDPSQVMAGLELRGQTVPDRGLLRQLEQLQAISLPPMGLLLLSETAIPPERLLPWQEACTARGLSLFVREGQHTVRQVTNNQLGKAQSGNAQFDKSEQNPGQPDH